MMSLVDLGKKLIESAKRGSTEEIRNLMANGAPFTTDWLGNSPLHFGAQSGSAATVQVLLRAGICRDSRTKVDRTPLHVAAREGHLDIVQLLIGHSADPNARDMLRMSPLHWAAEMGHIDIVQLLLNSGGDVTAFDKFDRTPMDVAMERTHMEIAQLIQNAELTSKTGVLKPDQLPVEEEEVPFTSEPLSDHTMTSVHQPITSQSLAHTTSQPGVLRIPITASAAGIPITELPITISASEVPHSVIPTVASSLVSEGGMIIEGGAQVEEGAEPLTIVEGVEAGAVVSLDTGTPVTEMSADNVEVALSDAQGTSMSGASGNSTSVLATLAALAEVTPPIGQEAGDGSNSEENMAKETLAWLESQGITAMISRPDGSVTALTGSGSRETNGGGIGDGQTVELTEAGKLALSNLLKENEKQKVVTIISDSNGEGGSEAIPGDGENGAAEDPSSAQKRSADVAVLDDVEPSQKQLRSS